MSCREPSELIGLDHVAISDHGPTLSVGIPAGQSVGIFGPAGAGKSYLLRVLGGIDRPVRGTVTLGGKTCPPCEVPATRRTRPIDLARRARGPQNASIATEALVAARLWERRNEPISQLTQGLRTACGLLVPLTSDAKILLLDGHLDRLDPWTLRSVCNRLRGKRSEGACLVAVTNRPDLAPEFDLILVLRDRRVVYAGSYDDLVRQTASHVVTVSAERQPDVMALVAPFSISVQETDDGMRLQAQEGQELAARLLLEGYGNVRFVHLRPPTSEEAFLRLIR